MSIMDFIVRCSCGKDGDSVISQIPGDEGNISEEYTWEGQADEINSEEESADNDNGRTTCPVAEILTFDDPEPKPETRKRKSQLEQLRIPKPESRELTEDEQSKADELASEFGSFLRPQKSDDFWKGLDFGSAF
jgi:hypothetical protein